MKLQMHGQQLRVRIDEEELQQLRAGNALASTTVLPGGAAFRWRMQLHSEVAANLAAVGTDWQIDLPITAVDAYAGRLPCKQGLDFALSTDGGKPLELVFEVDVRDSVRRRGAPSRRE